MTETAGTVRPTDSILAAKYALRELLLVKDLIDLKREPIRGFRLAHRRFRRVHRAIERQTLALVSDLTSMGVDPVEIGELIRATQLEAKNLRAVAE